MGYLQAGIGCLAVAALAGCAAISGPVNENANINGAQQLPADDAAARRVDLPRLIFETSAPPKANLVDYTNLCTSAAKPVAADTAGQQPASSSATDAATGRSCLEVATKAFYADTFDQAARRNRIQSRLLAASDAECAQFVQHLNSLQSYGNFFAGSLATIFSGAGAISTHVNAARAFGGLGAISSGERAEFNADLFLQQAVPTVSKAITQQRRNSMEAILRSRSLSIEDYPLWDAIADAFKYNDQCSLVHGIAALDKSLQIAQDPGPKQIAQYWANFNRARAIADDPKTVDAGVSDTSIPDRTASTAPLIGSRPESLISAYQRALESAMGGERAVADALKVTALADTTCDTTKQDKDVAVAAHCLRLSAETSVNACKTTLVADAIDLSTKQAAVNILRAQSTAASQDLVQAEAARDKSLASVRAVRQWLLLVQATLDQADQAAAKAVRETPPKQADALTTLNDAAKAIAKLDCTKL